MKMLRFLFLLLCLPVLAQEVVQLDTVAELASVNPKLLGRLDGSGMNRATAFVRRYSTNVAIGIGAGTYVHDPDGTTTNAYGGSLAATGGGTWELVAPQVVTPFHFGAVGDGVADDTAALNALLSLSFRSISLGGGTFGVNNAYQATNASGYYWTNAVNANVSGMHLTGPGTIRSLADTNVGIVLLQINGDHNTVEGVTFDGNFTAYGESDTSGIGLRVFGSDNRIVGNTFTNTGYIGVQVESSQSVSGTDFPTPSVTLGETVISQNVFYNSHTTAILTKPGGLRRTVITDNIITAYALSGMKIDAEPPATDEAAGELVISGNVITDGDTALGYSTSTGAQGGITLEEGLSNVVVANNVINGGTNTTGGAGFRGIYLSAGQSDKSVSNVTMTGNHISNIDGEGILLRVEDVGRFDNVTISGGSINGVGGVGITSSTLGTTKSLINHLSISDVTIRDAPYGVQLTSVIQSADVSVRLFDIGASGIVVSSLTNCVIHDTTVNKYGLTNASARGIQLIQCTGIVLRDTSVVGDASGLYGIEFVGTHSSVIKDIDSSWNRSHGILVTSSSTNLVFQNITGKNNGRGGNGYLLNLSSGDDIEVNNIFGVDDQASSTMPYVLVAANGVDVTIRGIDGRGYSTSLYTFTGTAARNVIADLTGYGSPEGVVKRWPGSIYRDMYGGTATTLWIKETGSGNTGWTKVSTNPTTETLSYSGTTVTVTGGKGPNQSSVLTCTNDFTLTFASVADNGGGTIWVHPAATNCTVTLSSPAYGPSGTTLTINGGTGSTNHTVIAWKVTAVNSTNVIDVNALNYYR